MFFFIKLVYFLYFIGIIRWGDSYILEICEWFWLSCLNWNIFVGWDIRLEVSIGGGIFNREF